MKLTNIQMMKKALSLFWLLILLVTLNSCDQKKSPIFDSSIIEKDGQLTLQYVPATDFKTVRDSIFFYYSKDDYTQVIAGDILKGETIHKTDNFMIKTMARKYFKDNKTTFEILLRTFKTDMRLIDDMVIGSTRDSIPFYGKLKTDLSYEITDENGNSRTGMINEYGRFINDNNE